MSIRPSLKKAKDKYKKKVTVLRMELYPTDEDIKKRLEDIDEPKATYIKRLIREDMKKENKQ